MPLDSFKRNRNCALPMAKGAAVVHPPDQSRFSTRWPTVSSRFMRCVWTSPFDAFRRNKKVAAPITMKQTLVQPAPSRPCNAISDSPSVFKP